MTGPRASGRGAGGLRNWPDFSGGHSVEGRSSFRILSTGDCSLSPGFSLFKRILALSPSGDCNLGPIFFSSTFPFLSSGRWQGTYSFCGFRKVCPFSICGCLGLAELSEGVIKTHLNGAS